MTSDATLLGAPHHLHPASQTALVAAVEPGVVVVGTRFGDGGLAGPSLRAPVVRSLAWLTRRVSGLTASDPLSGAVAAHPEDIPHFADAPQRLSALSSFVLLQAQRHGLRVTELHVAEAESSETRPIDVIPELVSVVDVLVSHRLEGRAPLWRRLFPLISTLVAVGLLAWLLTQHASMLGTLADHIPAVLGCTGLLLLSIGARAWRFVDLAGGWNIALSFRASLGDLITGRYSNELLPMRAGDLFRYARMQRRDGVSPLDGAVLLLAEKIAGLVALLFLPVSLLIAFSVANAHEQASANATSLGVTALGLGIGLSVACLVSLGGLSAARALWRALVSRTDAAKAQREVRSLEMVVGVPGWRLRFAAEHLPQALETLGLSVRGGLQSPRRSLAIALIHTALTWTLEGAALWLLALALGVPIHPALALGAVFVGMGATVIRVLPGGAGQLEAAAATILALAGIPVELAVLICVMHILLVRVVNIALGLAQLALPKRLATLGEYK